MMKILELRYCRMTAGSRRSRRKTERILHRLLTTEMILNPQTMHLQPEQETEAGREIRQMMQILRKSSGQQYLQKPSQKETEWG